MTGTFWVDVTDTAMGIMLVFYQATQPETSAWSTVALNFNYPYFTISLSLNILLTLMILGRLVLYARDVKRAVGTTPGLSGIYKAVVVVLVESSSLYALSFLLFIGPWGAKSQVSGIFLPILAETQVRASFFHIPSRTSISELGCLTEVVNRSSLQSSLLYVSPTAAR